MPGVRTCQEDPFSTNSRAVSREKDKKGDGLARLPGNLGRGFGAEIREEGEDRAGVARSIWRVMWGDGAVVFVDELEGIDDTMKRNLNWLITSEYDFCKSVSGFSPPKYSSEPPTAQLKFPVQRDFSSHPLPRPIIPSTGDSPGLSRDGFAASTASTAVSAP